MCVCCFVSPQRRLLRCFAVFEYYCLLLLRLTEEPTTTAVHVEWFKLVTIYPSMRHSQNEIAWPFVASSVVLSGDEFSARRSLKWWWGTRRENPCRVKVGNGVKYMTGFHNVVHDECVWWRANICSDDFRGIHMSQSFGERGVHFILIIVCSVFSYRWRHFRRIA